MSLATDGFSAMINVFPMALAGWVYQSRENARKSSFSSGGNVAEKTVEVKAGKFLTVAGRRWKGHESPAGAKDTPLGYTSISAVPDGTRFSPARNPSDESLGYCL